MRSGPVHGGVGTSVDVDIDRLMKSLSSAASAAGMKSDQAMRSVKKQSGVASHGFNKKLPDDKSPAVRAAHEARASVAQQHAAERLRQKVVGQANQVPYVNTSDSGDIEKLIRGIELAGVMAANKAAGC